MNVAELKVHKTKKGLSIKERLALSCINISNHEKFPPQKLSDNSYALVNCSRKALTK